jgi:hypothetical protein
MTKYPVFTSYAQLDRDKYLEKFVDEFRKQLRSVTGRPDAIALAFFDRDGVQAGDRWSEKIVQAIATADVLLCLMSPTYFTREWCGRELELFLGRLREIGPAALSVRFIFPVWWQMPATPRPLPRRLGQHNYHDPTYPPAYERSGIRGLARQGQWRQFRQMIDSLAARVAQTLAQPCRLPDAPAVADISQIVNAFDEQQPFDVCVIALTPGGDAWVPSAGDVSIQESAGETARRLLIFVRKLELGPELAARLERAKAEEQVILVVCDASSQSEDLETINSLELPSLSVLLVDAALPTVGAERWLARFRPGAFARAKASGLMRLASPGDLQPQMERLVDDARRKLQAVAPSVKAQDQNLTSNALSQGISVDVKPNLTGPAAEEQPR